MKTILRIFAVMVAVCSWGKGAESPSEADSQSSTTYDQIITKMEIEEQAAIKKLIEDQKLTEDQSVSTRYDFEDTCLDYVIMCICCPCLSCFMSHFIVR